MWTLLIISVSVSLNEIRITEYDKYATALECQQAWYKVTSKFTQDEIAVCEEPT